ncbi:MAG: monovalent cation/H(+) antiporter subunit G [Akkermansiaceae bacterium]
MPEIIAAALSLLGCFAILLASIGLVRFPDFFARTHAATKASAFGIALLLVAVCIQFPQVNIILKSSLCLVALFLTLPVGSQALANAARKYKTPQKEQ